MMRGEIMESKNTFFNTLNTSQNLNSVFEYFTSYRENITRIIVNEIQEIKTKPIKILVFGAGNLMDIDYNKLLSLEDTIDLMVTDIVFFLYSFYINSILQ